MQTPLTCNRHGFAGEIDETVSFQEAELLHRMAHGALCMLRDSRLGFACDNCGEPFEEHGFGSGSDEISCLDGSSSEFASADAAALVAEGMENLS